MDLGDRKKRELAGVWYLYYQGEDPLYLTTEMTADGCFIELPEKPEWPLQSYRVRGGALELKSQVKRVGMICNWGQNCGIATYSNYLADSLKLEGAELKIFSEGACWERNGPWDTLLDQVAEFDPDLILIQHEFGIFHRMDQWMALLSQLSPWRTVTILHTVLDHRVDHAEISQDYQMRSLAEAACPEVMVHCEEAKHCLVDRGYSGKVHVIPHGCMRREVTPLPSTKYGMMPLHTIFQYGFGGRHKGWERAMDVVEILRFQFPDVFYTGVMNHLPGDLETISYHASLLQQIRDRNLTQNFSLLRGFQSEKQLSNLIRGHRLCLFPYQPPHAHWKSWGASGAVQLPLAHGVPVVLSDFPAFQEFRGRLPVCSTVQEMADEISRIFEESDYDQKLRSQSQALAQERDWSVIARTLLESGHED